MPKLLEPFRVKGFTLRNRIVMPPMQSGRATLDGEVTNRLVNFYVKRSKFVGLPIVEHAFISLIGKLSLKQLGVYDDALIPGFTKLANAIHNTGAPAILQITHAGGVTNKNIIHTQPVGPSSSGKARQLQKNELEIIVNEFVLAANRAIKSGFDGVELHGAHGYLLCQFFSPLLNKRSDEYGGSLKNRMRFPMQVVEQIREAIGAKLLLYRLGSDDLTPHGINISDSVLFAKELEHAGVDIIDVSGGMCGAEPKQLKNIEGYFLTQANEIKKNIKLPVIGVGGICDPEYADKIVRDEVVDLVAVGRALLRDPDWAKKAFEKLKT